MFRASLVYLAKIILGNRKHEQKLSCSSVGGELCYLHAALSSSPIITKNGIWPWKAITSAFQEVEAGELKIQSQDFYWLHTNMRTKQKIPQ